MQVCVVGWDFNKSLYASLAKADYDTFIIMHKKGDTHGVPFYLIPNEGLEWGAYDHFLKNHWDKKSPVLFMQDDISILKDSFFDLVNSIDNDLIFIHDTLAKQIASERLFSGTGQCFKASPKFLSYLWKHHGGFWYDSRNTGNFDSEGTQDAAIGAFIQRLREMDKNSALSVNNHFFAKDYIIIN